MIELPDWLVTWFNDIKDQFYLNFIKDDRYRYILKGLGVTLEVTFFAVLLGIALGVVAAIVRSTHDKLVTDMRKGVGRFVLNLLNAIVKLYLVFVLGQISENKHTVVAVVERIDAG